ncbi:MAG: Nif3-like dinuclear metal center hexameric protein [Clostridiales Family XIII bacterium]|jgi:dinuclear metal center YbgI/SA1388 family protein|nr:Nif3-like dinuclear metal center hexameric protein [Clostridiales Family XIII bacterium]
MSIKTTKLIAAIEDFAPLQLQESWDNSGWQINPGREETARILVALEIINPVIEEAKRLRADFILTHHPLLFVPVKRIDYGDITGGYVASLISAGIGVYSAHTSFDAAPGGMNDSLAELIGLVNVVPFPPIGEIVAMDVLPGDGGHELKTQIARAGEFETPMTFRDVCRRVERVLGMKGRLKTVGDPDTLIEKVALCGGGGGDLVEAAIKSDCRLYITSDVKHHQAQWAKERGLCLIDGGHDGTEKHFITVAAKYLRETLGENAEVIETAVSADPFKFK